jgi:hypothetical protein
VFDVIEATPDRLREVSEQDDGAKRLTTVPGIGPIIRRQQRLRSAGVTCSPKAEISELGSVSCRDRCRRVGAPSSGLISKRGNATSITSQMLRSRDPKEAG